MKEGYAVVRFKDTKVAKIAHLSIVRKVDKSPFDPKSCKDFIIGDDVQVKWQQSLTDGILQDDGFYDAQIFAIAPSVVTAEKKAKELRIKLPQCPLISIEAKSTPLPTQDIEKQSSRRKQGSRSENNDSMLKLKSKHRHSRLDVTKEKGNGEKNSATRRNAEKDHTENLEDKSVSKKHGKIDINESDISDSDELKDKGKSKDPIALKRLQTVIDDSLKTNPLFQVVDSSGTDCELSKNSMTSKIKPTELDKKSNSQEKENGADNPSKRNKKEKDQKGNQKGDFDENNIYEKAEESKSGKLGNHDTTNPISCSGPIETDDSVKASKVLSGFNPEGMPNHSTPSKSKPMVEAKNSSEQHFSPVMKAGFEVSPLKEDSLKSPLSSGHKSLILSDLKRHNETPVLTTPSKKIKKDNFKASPFIMSSASKQPKRHVQNLFKKDLHDDELEDTLPMGSGSESETSLFHQSDSGSEDDTVKLLEKIASLQKCVGRKKREVKDLRRDLSAAVKLIDQLKLKIDQLQQSMSEDCEQEAESTNEKKTITNEKKTINQSKKGSPKVAKVVNKKKSIKKSINFDNEIINNVSEKVLKHLKKTERLPLDETGKIDLGYSISIPDDSFRKNFKENRLDMDKAAKNMTSMVWSRSERLCRSLEGQGTNRFKDSTPKQPATPAKVQVILGCLKGHMLKEGDSEGPRMASSLKSCAKAIGDKFAQDAYNKKREEARAAKTAAAASAED